MRLFSALAILIATIMLTSHPYSNANGYVGAYMGDCTHVNVGVNVSSPIGPYVYVDEC